MVIRICFYHVRFLNLRLLFLSILFPLCFCVDENEGEEEKDADEEENAPLDGDFDDLPPESDYDDVPDEKDDEDLEWITIAVRDIGFYLRSHKFNDFDRRFYTPGKEIVKEFVENFPIPALRSLHWEVRNHCDRGFRACIMYLHEKVLLAELKRSDDTTTIIRENKLDEKKNKSAVQKINDECLRKYNLDYIGGLPFGGPLERFQWRTSASYYMCWFTMQEVKDLAMFGEPCDNYARCLDAEWGARNGDVRARDSEAFACAAYSFCPDPCCPLRLLRSQGECWNASESPCFASAAPPHRACCLNRSLNADFAGVVLNRWNTSCNCSRRGFRWSAPYRTCVDVDECVEGAHACDRAAESCFNLPGAYRCGCRWGFLFDAQTNACQPSPELLGQGWAAPAPAHAGRWRAAALALEAARDRLVDFYENVRVYFVQRSVSNPSSRPHALCLAGCVTVSWWGTIWNIRISQIYSVGVLIL